MAQYNKTNLIDITLLGKYDEKIKAFLKAEDKKITDLVGTLPEGATATTVTGYAKEVADGAESAAKTASAITLTTAETPTEGYLKTYVLAQNSTEIGKIDLPKELVVTKGEVVVIDAEHATEALPAGTYIKLTIANQTDPIYIDVKKLCDVYTAAQSATQVQLAISDTNEISATIVAGSISKTELATTVVSEIEAATTAIGKATEGETAGTGLTKRVEDLESAIGTGGNVDTKIKNAIEALDATVSNAATEAGTTQPDVVVSVVEADGKLTSVTASVTANRFDAYGAASAVQGDTTDTVASVKAVADAAMPAADIKIAEESEINALFSSES